jgi:predicted small lipoprotein YifL
MRISTSILAPLALLLVLNLAACGNKGPLVRPSAEPIEDVEDVEPASEDAPVADPDETTPVEDIPVEDTDEDAGVDPPPPADAGPG